MSEFIRFSNTCNRDAVPLMDQSQIIYLLTELSPGTEISNVRMPLNFALVLDRSGSMAGEKLRMMKEAVKKIIDQLSDGDLLSIVTFESRTEVLLGGKSVVEKKTLGRMIDRIRDGGGTNVAPALRTALNLVSTNASENRVNRIILLTDGEATDPEADSFQVADEAGAKGIPIVGLGFGQEWNETFLMQLADRSILAQPGSNIGLADYIPQPEDAGRIFQEVYQSMQVVANDLLLTIRMVQGLEARKVWQIVPMIRELGASAMEGRAIQIPVGQLERTGAAYLIEMMLPPRPEGTVRFAQADITFSTPEHGTQRQADDLLVQFTSDPESHGHLNKKVMDVVEKVQAFRLQTQALEDVEMGDVGNATRRLRQAVTILLAQGEKDLADQMEKEAERLEQSGEVSSDGKKTIILTSRKTVRLSE